MAKKVKHPLLKNLQASAEEIETLALDDAVAAIMHPNCPPDLWWGLAEMYPWEAMNSPAYAIMTLESPEQWTELLSTHVNRWLDNEATALPPRKKRLFLCELVESLLFLFERDSPEETDLREALEDAKDYALGTLPKGHEKELLSAAHQKAKRVWEGHWNSPMYSRYVAQMVWNCTAPKLDFNHTLDVIHTVDAVRHWEANALRQQGDTYINGYDWQWGVLTKYLPRIK